MFNERRWAGGSKAESKIVRVDSRRVQAPKVELPRVSVITVFLDCRQYLAEAIDSVLAQDFTNFELILVDDGSTDGSTEIARGYAELYPTRIRYVDHAGHTNLGISATRNLGLRKARAELIAFLDADDVWQPHKLSEQVAFMDAHPKVGMLCGTVRYWSSWAGGTDRIVPTGLKQNQVLLPPRALIELYPLGKGSAPCPSDCMFRKSLAWAVGGFEEHFTGWRQLYEDQGFLAKFYLASPVYCSERIWINYRQHDGSCCAEANKSKLYHDARHYFLKWLEGYLVRFSNNDPSVREAVFQALSQYRNPRQYRLYQFVGAARNPGVLVQKMARKLKSLS